MACIPCDSYASKAYWEKRYEEGLIEHEWYYGFDTLQPILQSLRSWNGDDKVLEVGCGDRPLVNEFVEFGVEKQHLFGIDYAKSVIEPLVTQHPLINFDEMDACNMSFEDNTFACVIDKGTMDAILSHKNRKVGISNSKKLLSEIVRVMQQDAQFMLISHIEVESEEFEVFMEDILLPALSTKSHLQWAIEAHLVSTPQPKQKKAKKAKEAEEPSGYGTVYVVKSRPRRFTRSSLESTADRKAEVTFKVLEYELD